MITSKERFWAKTYVLAAVLIVAGCSSEDDIVDMLDDIEKENGAEIQYVNSTLESQNFYTKSSIYPNSVYLLEHRVTEVQSFDFSTTIPHHWIDGGQNTTFGIELGGSDTQRTSQKESLIDKKPYWVVAMKLNGSHQLRIFEKSSTAQPYKYSLRILTNASLTVTSSTYTTHVLETTPGEVSSSFVVDTCSDLAIGSYEINLCQTANLGSSYLIVLDSHSGQYLVLPE